MNLIQVCRRFLLVVLWSLSVQGLMGQNKAHESKGVDQIQSLASAADQVADPRAVVTAGQARFTVLTPRMLRMEWSAAARFEDHASLVFLNRRLPVPHFQVQSQDGSLVLTTDSLVLKYKLDSGKFDAANLSIALQVAGRSVLWTPGSVDTGNLGGTTRTLDGADGEVPLEPGLLSRDGWVLVDDSKRPLFDASDWPWAMPRPEGEHQDFYFFGYGHAYKQALADFTRVAGKIPMPPRFAFGAWWSRYWAYTDQELIDLVRGFQSHEIPLDVLVIDMDWHLTLADAPEPKVDQSGHYLGWTGYTWDKNYFPDPPAFLTWVHEQGLKDTLNMHPASGVQPHEEQYAAMARAMGVDPGTKKYVPFDIANKKFAENYMNILHHPLEGDGVDFFWLDWQQESQTTMPGLSPTFWLNYVHTTDMERRGKRPLIFHRWGGLGNHRYQIGFSGDTISNWRSLAFQPRFTATASNVGYGYWSHDIGGHMPGAIEPELYTRWIQFGIFSPIVRTHTTKNPLSERRTWAYPVDYSEAMRQAFLLRYAMIPYIYTASREAYDTGVSMLRPMYYDYPEAVEAYEFKDQYLFGDSMLVAPIIAPQNPETRLATRSLWLPEGEWIEWFTGSRLKGPARLMRSFTLDEIPVYVKAGSIIPMQPQMSHTDEKPVDPLILAIFPGASGQTRLYDDDGNSLGYKSGQYTWTDVRYSAVDNTTAKIEVMPVRGSYPKMLDERGYEIRLQQSWPPESVTWNGKPIAFDAMGRGQPGWHYDGSTLTTIVTVPKSSVRQKVEVTVKVSAAAASQTQLLDGVPGRLRRLRGVGDILNGAWPKGWNAASLVKAEQTGRRVELNPASALQELLQFNAQQADVVSAIQRVGFECCVADRALAHMEIEPQTAKGVSK